MAHTLSRRNFLGIAGGTAALAGLGLAACAGPTTGGPAGVEPQNGTPATTDLSRLPLPERGKTYNNPKGRDEVRDGGTLVLPAGEVGPNWNYLSVEGNTSEMSTFWSYYMPTVLTMVDATASSISPNPDFVTSIESSEESGRQVITYTLNDAARFNDGTPLDWRAVQAAWQILSGKDGSFAPAATDGWDKMVSVELGASDKQAIITLSEPVYPAEMLVNVLVHPAAVNADTFANGWNSNPHSEWGAGPYTIDFVNDMQVTFVPNPTWWGERAKLDSITYKQMDAQALFNAFKNGEIDATGSSSSGSAEMLSNFSSMADAEVRRGDGLSLVCIEVNSTREGLSDRAVRKAFCQCLDAATLRDIVFQGVNWKEETPGSILIPAWRDGYENNMPADVTGLTSADDRIAAAKRTLEDAGYSLDANGHYAKDGRGVEFNLVVFGDSNVTKNRAAAIQKMAKDAGIKLELQNKAASEFSSTLTGGEWDTILTSWGFVVTAMWYGKMIFGSHSVSNYTQWGTPELDAEFDRINSIKDSAGQLKAYNAAEKKALESYCFIPLYAGPDVVVTKKGLANFGPALFQTVLPQDVGWEKAAS